MRANPWVVMVASGLALMACKPEREARGPRATNVEGAAPNTRWTLWDGRAPSLMYFDAGLSVMSFGCAGTGFVASVNGFEAAQAWPQPELSFRFGDEVVTGLPDAAVQERGVSLSIRKSVSDRLLMAMDTASEVKVSFNGQEREVALPERTVDAFLGLCRTMTAPAMR